MFKKIGHICLRRFIGTLSLEVVEDTHGNCSAHTALELPLALFPLVFFQVIAVQCVRGSGAGSMGAQHYPATFSALGNQSIAPPS